jgi:dienelactone hydrolase
MKQTRIARRFQLSSLAALVLAVLVSLYPVLRLQLRAAALLLRIQNPQTQNALVKFSSYPIDELATTIDTPGGSVPAKLYVPRNVANPPAMLVLHGVHHLGIEEPRLVNFARALAAGGIEVLTPELQSLADYRVDPRDIPVIGAAAHELHERAGVKPGILGLSFSGGLALLNAAAPQYAGDVAFVIAIGAHDDLERVSRYLATGEIARPDGSIEKLAPHEYGTLVLVYAHIEDYFAPVDRDTAREAIRLQLWEDVNVARARAAQLSPAGLATMQLLLDHKDSELAPAILAHLPQHAAEMALVSPHGRLASLQVPVLLLHGAEDNVIPAAESLWLALDIPHPCLRKLLITPLITHVEVNAKPSWQEKGELFEFMVAMLKESDRWRAGGAGTQSDLKPK